MRKYILIIAVFFIGSNLFAQTQLEMNLKAHNDFVKVDAALNKVYKQLIKALGAEDKQLLIIAQKDWLKFRDSHCKFEINDFEGGSIQPLIYSTCLMECTKNRVKDLKTSLKNRDR